MNYLPVQKPKLAFTTNAFVRALQTHGELIFQLVPIYGKLLVDEHALIGHPEIVNEHLDTPWLKALIDHWFDIKDPYVGIHAVSQEEELTNLIKLNHIEVDNVIVFVDKLSEYSALNRTYANDDLKTVADIPNFLEVSPDVNRY